jgi:phosphoglycolate phosphatase-like HAD superfamily hydrolase
MAHRNTRSLPSASEAIADLVAEGTVQSVVTGNIRSIAATKLDAFDLMEYFDLEVGGYGDDDDGDRAVLVRLAIKRAEAKYGVSFAPGRVVVIGDTPHDIKGAPRYGRPRGRCGHGCEQCRGTGCCRCRSAAAPRRRSSAKPESRSAREAPPPP